MYIINKTKIIKTLKIIKYSLSALLALGIYIYYLHPQIIYYITAHSRSDDLKFVDRTINLLGIQIYKYEYIAKLDSNVIYKNIKLPHVTNNDLAFSVRLKITDEWPRERLETVLDFRVKIRAIINGKISYHNINSKNSLSQSEIVNFLDFHDTIIEINDGMPKLIDEISIEIDRPINTPDFYFVISSGAGL